jgi:hypothetical protein
VFRQNYDNNANCRALIRKPSPAPTNVVPFVDHCLTVDVNASSVLYVATPRGVVSFVVDVVVV